MEEAMANKLIAEIQLLKEEIKSIKESLGIRQEQKKIVVEVQKSQTNPRQGNYTSEDVSIEKFFYYGHK